jgi:hypothetical protein
VWTAAALATAAIGLAGCGTEDVSPDAVAQAAKTTAETGTARMHQAMTLPVEGESIEVEAEGVLDMSGQRASMTFDMGQIPGAGGEMEIVMADFVMWMRMSALEGQLPDGAEWIRADLRKVSKELGFDLGQFNQIGNDPSKQLDFLRATGEVEEEGSEEVRGVPTTHYSGTTDLRRYPDLLPERERAEARRGVEAMIEFMGDPEQDFEVWVDGKDLVRRMQMTVPTKGPEGEQIEMEMVQEYYDFGVDVDIETPPADDTVDFTEFVRRAARRGEL